MKFKFGDEVKIEDEFFNHLNVEGIVIDCEFREGNFFYLVQIEKGFVSNYLYTKWLREDKLLKQKFKNEN